MICPDSNYDCDNPGCRRGGCQRRRPALPLFRTPSAAPAPGLSLFATGMAAGASASQTAGLAKDAGGRLAAV
jgi:hypothetical protein